MVKVTHCDFSALFSYLCLCQITRYFLRWLCHTNYNINLSKNQQSNPPSPQSSSPPFPRAQNPGPNKMASVPIRTRRLSVLLSPSKTINKRCATPQTNAHVSLDGAVISVVIQMLCDVCHESGTTADLVK